MRPRQDRGLTLIELMIVMAIIGILVSVALPNFIKFRMRAQQSEAKAGLRTWFTTEQAYFGEEGKYLEEFNGIGFSLERGNRYSYRFSPACVFEARTAAIVTSDSSATCITADQYMFPLIALAPSPAPISTNYGSGSAPLDPGLGGTCPDCAISGVATANLDAESAGIDTWLLSTQSGNGTTTCGGGDTRVTGGTPFHLYNDGTCD